MSSLEHAGVRTVLAALRAAGQDKSADGIRILDEDARTAAAAAEALGIEVGAIANSLVFRAVAKDGTVTPLLALTSGAHRADPQLLADLAGVATIKRADPEFVRQHTGQAIGGVAPVGHPEPVLTVIDGYLARFPVVWAAAGHPKSVFPTTFARLVELTGGTAATVAHNE
jgi:prolyl-tRNA editing enzyme YbaK/EbsC (Cys-tRNA(Pro) deacylase)